MILPIAMLTIIIRAIASVNDADDDHGEDSIYEHLRPLSMIMLALMIVLIILFLTSGILLLRTLKKYS